MKYIFKAVLDCEMPVFPPKPVLCSEVIVM